MKKLIALLLTAAVLLSMAACGSKSNALPAEEEADSGYVMPEIPAAESTGVTITLLNTRSELQEAFEIMAKRYLHNTGVEVDVHYLADASVEALEERYESGNVYTITMAEPQVVYAMGPEYGLDMALEPWVEHTNYAISLDGAVYGFPLCVEACGILYNADAVREVLGRRFDPASAAMLSDFQALLEEMAENGMKRPCGIQREDWSLGMYLAQVYAEQLDPNQFVDGLYAGTVDLTTNTKLRNFLLALDTLRNYNYAYKLPLSADRKNTLEKLGEGEIAFVFGTNWDWRIINNSDYSDNIGIMPIPQDTTDDSNRRLVGGVSEYFFVDGSDYSTDDERQAALDFLNWLAMDVNGNAFLTDSLMLVPAFDTITTGYMDPLGTMVKSYFDKGMMIQTYNFLPSDHTSLMGLNMQMLLSSQITLEEFFNYLKAYWTGVEPVAHYE